MSPWLVAPTRNIRPGLNWSERTRCQRRPSVDVHAAARTPNSSPTATNPGPPAVTSRMSRLSPPASATSAGTHTSPSSEVQIPEMQQVTSAPTVTPRRPTRMNRPLVRGALQPEGISRTDKGELASFYADLADYRSPLDLAAAEIADRVRPLLARSIESELAGLDSWPIRRGGLVGLYPRALVAAWTELTEASPPIACATPGCAGTVPPTRNRLYCDSCRASRRRDQAQRIRAGDTHPGGAESPSPDSRA
jgi:hypothetical protein